MHPVEAAAHPRAGLVEVDGGRLRSRSRTTSEKSPSAPPASATIWASAPTETSMPSTSAKSWAIRS